MCIGMLIKAEDNYQELSFILSCGLQGLNPGVRLGSWCLHELNHPFEPKATVF